MADPQARHAEVADAVESRVLAVLRSGRWVGGPVVAEAEAFAARSFGRAHAVGVASGTDGLMLALSAAGVRPGDEVIVPAVTFFATAGAVAAIGAVPVVADVVEEDGTLDPDAARRAVTPRTRAVVPVHLFGQLAAKPDLDLAIVDDSAQAIAGSPPRSYGALSTLSVYPTKTWAAAGDGGFVLGDDPDLVARVRRLGNHGLGGEPHVHDAIDGLVGRNSRLDALQAAVLLGQAPLLEERVARRRQLALVYDRGLPPWVRPLARDAGHPVHHYVVRIPQRDAVRNALLEQGIETALYYPRALSEQPALRNAAPAPVAEALCREALALPVHSGLGDDDVQAVIQALWDLGRAA